MGFSDRGYSRDSYQPFMADWTAVMTIMVVNIAIWVAVFRQRFFIASG